MEILGTAVHAFVIAWMFSNMVSWWNRAGDAPQSDAQQSGGQQLQLQRAEARYNGPAWPKGTVGNFTIGLTLGNASDSPELSGFTTTVQFGPVRNSGECKKAKEAFARKRVTANGAITGGLTAMYAADQDGFIFSPLADHAIFSVCASPSATVHFDGVDMTPAVTANSTVYVRVTFNALDTLAPTVYKYFPLTVFRRRRVQRARKVLLEDFVSQSPKYKVELEAGHGGETLALPAAPGTDTEPATSAAANINEAAEAKIAASIHDVETSAPDGTTPKAESALVVPTDPAASAVSLSTAPNSSSIMYAYPEMTLALVVERLDFASLPSQLADEVNLTAAGYMPVLFHHKFWVLPSRLLEVNTSNAVTVLENFTIGLEPMSAMKFFMYQGMEGHLRMQSDLGLDEGDFLKSMLLDNSPWYLALIVAVSMLRMIFEYLAFKNDVTFWREKKDLRGLSLRTVAMNCYCQLIIFLYLLDDGSTSWTVWLPCGVGVAIELWKLFQCLRFTRDPVTGRLRCEWNLDDGDETRGFDKTATRYMFYLGAPCLLLYTAYSMMYEEHAGWYSFAIRTQVRFIYYAGFVMMCSQHCRR
jgi:hypothetical protein